MAASRNARTMPVDGPPDLTNEENDAVEEDDDKLLEPCFEGYLRGAWWEVDIVEQRLDMLLVKYVQLSYEDDAWVPLSHLRHRARACDDWDCFILRRGVDVSVMTVHPLADQSLRKTKALYDAKILSVSKSKHKDDCYCKFSVQLYTIVDDGLGESILGRKLLSNVYALEEVHIRRLCILQQPGITPLHEVLKAHTTREWSVDQGRWSNDAYFLKETELRIYTGTAGIDGVTGSEDVRPDVVSLSYGLGNTVRLENRTQFRKTELFMKNSQVAAKTGSPNSGGRSDLCFHPKKGGLVGDTRQKSSPVEHSDRKLKRKHNSPEEDASNLVQEDATPVSSSRFTRSRGKIVGDEALGLISSERRKKKSSDDANKKPENAVDCKLARKVHSVPNASSEEDVVSDSSEAGKSVNEICPSHFLVDVRLNQLDLGMSKKSQNDHGNSKHSLQRAEPTPKSGSHVISKGANLPDKKAKQAPLTGLKLSPSSTAKEKGKWSVQDSKQRHYIDEAPDKKRWRDQSKVGDEIDWNGGSKIKNDYGGKYKQGTGSKERGAPVFTSVSTQKVASAERHIEIDPVSHERTKKRIRAPDDEKVVASWSKDREQQGSPTEGPSSGKGPRKKEEKGKIEPDLIRLDGNSSHDDEATEDDLRKKETVVAGADAQKYEDPSQDPRHQLRKLRPRRPMKLKRATRKSHAHNSSKANKSHHTSLLKVSKKEKIVAAKVVERPLYMDLLENNSKGESNAENPVEDIVREEASKVIFGLNDAWDPIGQDVNSDSDCHVVPNEVDILQMTWHGLETGSTTPGIAEMRPAPVHDLGEFVANGDQMDEVCDHKRVLKDDAGLVCVYCGIISTPIDEVMPVVDYAQRRHRHEDVDDWDKDFPVSDQAFFGYQKVESGNEVSMLNSCLPPHYANKMHPHQKEGFEFLWKHLAYGEGNERKRKFDRNSGCILSHAPGTGKSFLIISFLKSYMDKFLDCRPLIVAPKIMLREWEKEFIHWKSDIKVFILNTASVTGKKLLQKHEESNLISLRNHSMTARGSIDTYRMALLHEWRVRRSVCLVSYNLFSSLTDQETFHNAGGDLVRRSLLESPGILILDEGHFPRNKDTRVRKALMRVKTHARILLSGTLFQNNFEELFNTLYLVRPGFVEAFARCKARRNGDVDDIEVTAIEEVNGAEEKRARKIFLEEIGMKIEQGQLSLGSEVLKMGLERLQKLTSNFVHIHTGEVLQRLPGLRDFGILLKPTGWQSSLLGWVDKHFNKPEDYLKKEIAVSETSIHPTLLEKLDFIKNERDSSLINGSMPQYESLAPGNDKSPEVGVKTKFVFDLLRSLQISREKVLIFSQHITPLDLLEDMLDSEFQWAKSRDVLRLDGKLPIDERKEVIEKFNNPTNAARVLLASTKACGEGITLVGASRVVFLDVLWNPAVIKQAVSRAFRLGQEKCVYVYRLIALGTIEEKKYKKAIQKDWLSQAIFNPADENEGHEVEGLNPAQLISASAEILAWEVDANTCEDDQLQKLLTVDQTLLNSFSKVIEHGNAFHNRKTPCGPDVRQWFLEGWDDKELSQQKPGGEEPGAGFRLADKIFKEHGELGAFGAADAGTSSDTDEEDL